VAGPVRENARGIAGIELLDTADMTMTTQELSHHRLRSLIAGCVIVLGLLTSGASPLSAQTVAVMVNGEPITNYDIDQRTKLNFLTTHKQSTRQEVLDELINEKVKIKEAKKFGVDPGSSDVDELFTNMASRMRITGDQLAKTLEVQGIRPETLKARLKAEMVWGSLVRGRYKESLQVGEKDVAAVAQEGGEATQTDAFEYKMQPIVLLVPRGSAATATELRKKEAESLRERVTTCEQANAYFKSMQNAAIRDSVTKTSADLPVPLRELLDKTPIGHLTPPEVTKQGVEMVALCDRKPTKIDSPKKREIRDKMFQQKYEKKSKDYLDECRRAAMIEYR
jgi:peptidyl-prolyl cis-trans isomerase SurA